MARLKLNDSTAIVTGASRGIGPHIASALARRGSRVALVARSESELAAAARELTDAGAVAIAVPADVTSDDDRQAAMVATERPEQWPRRSLNPPVWRRAWRPRRAPSSAARCGRSRRAGPR